MDWFRWWHGTLTDPKFGWVAKKSGQPFTAVIALWVALLERASSVTQCDAGVTRGSVAGFDCDDYDVLFGLDDGSCKRIFDALVVKEMIVEDFIARWKDRQPQREDSSAERTRSYRERQKQAAEAEKKPPVKRDDVGDAVTHGDAASRGGDDKKREDKSKPKSKPKPSSSSGDDAVKPFDQFWAAYPRKVGKQDAVKAWGKLKPAPDLVYTILAAIAAQLEGHDWKREAGEFIPHPATWLNGGRWLDEVRPFVERPPRVAFDAWWETKEAMEAKGKSLTPPVLALAGDTIGSFRRRINEALERAGQPEQKREPTPYTPPAPVGGESVLNEAQKRARRQQLLAEVGSRKTIETELTEQ